MSRRKKTSIGGVMLDLWRPPRGAGDPIGCLATTYTFSSGLFDEQCLGRFLQIDSEPNREDLAFLLERESRLGGVYAGVLVDHTQAGVQHSLRWDVLPVRIPAGKQHAKVSLLVWSHHIRVVIASANLTEPGYRTNYEVTGSLDLQPGGADLDVLAATVRFLRGLILLVPGVELDRSDVRRAQEFLGHVESQVQGWKPSGRRASSRQYLVATLPGGGPTRPARSSLDEAILECRRRGGSPHRARVASPFFDRGAGTNQAVAALCKRMARGAKRDLHLCVPGVHDDTESATPRLAAPASLMKTALRYGGRVRVSLLPEEDGDGNLRAWHAKMLALHSEEYSALMVGSSNLTEAGMGVGGHRNAEANLLTIVDRVAYSTEVSQLEAIWPQMDDVPDPESAEWLGSQQDEEDDQTEAPTLPSGFLAATYRAGGVRRIVLLLDPERLPEAWSIYGCGQREIKLVSSADWDDEGRRPVVELSWEPLIPPEKLRVEWGNLSAFLPLNVEDGRDLPPPPEVDQMTSDDMLNILAATDPSAAFRLWAKRLPPDDSYDPDLDSAEPVDLDPLRRYDLEATFLHRIRRRARILARLRANLERPVWGRQALEWRLRGLVGVQSLAERMARECAQADGAADESLLTLADCLIVLGEVDYKGGDGAITKAEFEETYGPFLEELASTLRGQIDFRNGRYSREVTEFWERVVERCGR